MLSSEELAGTLLASAARAADAYSPEMINNRGFKGVLITMITSAEVGTCSVTPTIQFLDPASKTWITAKDGDPITTETTTTWMIYPATGLKDGVFSMEGEMPLPVVWRFFWNQTTADTTTGFTVSVGYQYLP